MVTSRSSEMFVVLPGDASNLSFYMALVVLMNFSSKDMCYGPKLITTYLN